MEVGDAEDDLLLIAVTDDEPDLEEDLEAVFVADPDTVRDVVRVPVEVRVEEPVTVDDRVPVIDRVVVGELDEVREDLADPEVEPDVVGVRDPRLEPVVVRVTVLVRVLEDVPVEDRLLVLVRVIVVVAVEDFERVADLEDDDDVVDVLLGCEVLEAVRLPLGVRDAIADRVPVRVDVEDRVGKAPATAS